MAGIGFRLRELAQKESLWATLQVHIYSAMISSGPWVITILNLFIISLWNPGAMDDVDRATMFCMISYAMAFSFVITGTVSLAFTRYLADQVYQEKYEELLPALNGFLLFILTAASVVGYLFVRPLPLSAFVKFCGLLLFLALSCLWVIMIYLSTLRDYVAITTAFALGAVGGWALALGLGKGGGLALRLLGFTFGQLVTAALLALRLFKELGAYTAVHFRFLPAIRRYSTLVAVGILYHAGFWVDKVLFWRSPYGMRISGFAICPFYDTALFFAQLTMIPTITLFLVHIETHFFETYREYYRECVRKLPLAGILASKIKIHQSLRQGLELILKYQGAVSLLAIASAESLVALFHLDPAQIPLLRIALLGAFVQSLMHVILILVLYFDLQKVALAMTAAFAFSNFLLTRLTIEMGVPAFGYGYLGACFCALVVGYVALDRAVANLEYYTFAKQPILPVA